VDDAAFLWTVHFRHSLPSDFQPQGTRRDGGLNIMTSLRDIAGEPNEGTEPTLPAPRLPKEPRAPVAILSAAKRSALIACFNAGELTKKNGAWHGLPDDKPTSGVTIADLARDGMLTLTTDSRVVSARLTERGNWFARTLLCDPDVDVPRKRMTKPSDGSMSTC
jgi:hypothetical protein